MLTVLLLLDLCNIQNIESKSIDSVLDFPQPDLDVYIWMELPIGFVVDEVAHGENHSYVLKSNKSIYGIKQASLNCTTTTVAKGILNQDLAGNPHKLPWKHRRAVGMLS